MSIEKLEQAAIKNNKAVIFKQLENGAWIIYIHHEAKEISKLLTSVGLHIESGVETCR